MTDHRTEVARGHAKYFVVCSACSFNPEWTPDRTKAERWAAEHELHPDRDVSGIWGWSRWRAVRGVNHAWPFGTAPCGTLRTTEVVDARGASFTKVVDVDGPADPSLPMCPVCVAMAPPDRELPPDQRD